MVYWVLKVSKLKLIIKYTIRMNASCKSVCYSLNSIPSAMCGMTFWGRPMFAQIPDSLPSKVKDRAPREIHTDSTRGQMNVSKVAYSQSPTRDLGHCQYQLPCTSRFVAVSAGGMPFWIPCTDSPSSGYPYDQLPAPVGVISLSLMNSRTCQRWATRIRNGVGLCSTSRCM